MVSIGKIADRIGFDNGDLVYLGNKSGIAQTELDSDNGVFFDTNNINKFVVMNNDNNVEETTTSFINEAKFYTCKNNADNGLCFRCVSNCVDCVNCITCNAACWGCDCCTTCNGCISGCNVCVKCNSCTSCNNNVNSNGHRCYVNCAYCVSNCVYLY